MPWDFVQKETARLIDYLKLVNTTSRPVRIFVNFTGTGKHGGFVTGIAMSGNVVGVLTSRSLSGNVKNDI